MLDSSPGTSCNVVKTLDEADYALLVTEPTKFGLHDLRLAVALVKKMNIPHGIIINRHHSGENVIKDYCQKENIKLVGEIPFSRRVAEQYSRGNLLIHDPEFKEIFEKTGANLLKEIENESTRRVADAVSDN